MKPSLSIPHYLPLLTFLAFAVTSCSDSTSPGDSSGGNIPAEGSTYATTITIEDGQGGVLSSQNQTATVEHAPGYNGKENVARYVVEGGGQDMYIAFEDDGRVSIEYLMTLAGQQKLIWVPITVTSGNSVDEEVFNETQDAGGGVTLKSTARVNAEHVGTESVMVAGETFEAQRTKGEIIATFEYVGAGTEISMSLHYDVAWIAEVSMFGRYDMRLENGPQFTRQVLTDYSLK